jgi:ubiquinone biosynthesis protein UbiJ
MLAATLLPTLLPALHRVLDTQPAALARLAAHNGKFVRLGLPGLSVDLEIVEDGHFIPPRKASNPP